ncbi:hypothetical protein L218DRAFT_887190, partial [Marasmius fiardii PR-910]
RFHNNVLQMKKLAVHGLLQCTIALRACSNLTGRTSPVRWTNLYRTFCSISQHGNTKLHLHTNSTVATFEEVTKDLGKVLQQFQTAAAKYDIYETPKEVAAHQCHKSVMAQKAQSNSTSSSEPPQKGKKKAGLAEK